MNMKRLRKSWTKLRIVFLGAIVLFASINLSSLILASDQLAFAENDNVKVYVQQTVDTDEGVNITLDAKVKDDSIMNGITLPSTNYVEGSSTTYKVSENGAYKFQVHYTYQNEKKSIDVDVNVDGVVKKNDTTITNTNNEVKEADIAARNALIQPLATTGLELNMSTLNNPNWTEADYTLYDSKQKSFSFDLKYYPPSSSGNGRKLVVKIPKYFAFNLPTITSLPGDLSTSTEKIEIDYAGKYDGIVNGVDKFTWDEAKAFTTITFYLKDTPSGSEPAPISLELPIVQDYASIAASGVSPSVKYEFSAMEGSMKDTVLFDIPFIDSGFVVNTAASSYTAPVTNTDGAMTYTINSHQAMLKSSISGDVKKLDDLALNFALKKDKSAVPLDSFEVTIPVPTGYKLRDNTNNKFVSAKGGTNGTNVTMVDGWYTYNETTNTIKIKLDKTQAEDLLTNTTYYGDTAATFNFYFYRVDASGKEYSKDTSVINTTNVIPFSFDGESLTGGDIKYTFNKLNGSGTTSVPSRGSLTIAYPQFNNTYKFSHLASAGYSSSLTQGTNPANLVNGYWIENASWTGRIYKNVDVTYDFKDGQAMGLNILGTHSEVQQYDDVKITLYYVTSAGTEGSVDISSQVSGSKFAKTNFADFIPSGAEATKVNFHYNEYIMYASGSASVIASSKLSLSATADISESTKTAYIYATFKENGNLIASNNYPVIMNVNNNKPAINVTDQADTQHGVRKKISDHFASGSLSIPVNTPSAKNASVKFSGDEVLSLTDNIRIVGGQGTIKYTVKGDSTVYTTTIVNNINNSTNFKTEFPKVDVASGKYITSLEFVFDGMESFPASRSIGWYFYSGGTTVPDTLPLTGELIPDGTTYQLSAIFDNPNVSIDLRPNASGKTVTYIDADAYLVFNEGAMNYSDTPGGITLDRAYSKPFASVAIKAPGANTAIFTDAQWSIDTSKQDAKDMLSLLGSVKIGYSKSVDGSNLNVGVMTGTLTYKVFNPVTNTIETRTKAYTGSTSGTVVSFGLADGEYITDLKMNTDMFESFNNQKEATFGMEFYFNKQYAYDETPLKTTIQERVYEIPTKLEGMIEGSHYVYLQDSVTKTPPFKKPSSVSGTLTDNETLFSTAKLNTAFSISSDPSYVFIEDGRNFSKPVFQWKLVTDPTLSDLKDAVFYMRNADGSKLNYNLQSALGGLKFTTTSGSLMSGTVEYDVFDKNTHALKEVRSVAISASVVFVLADDEYVDDIRIKADNLKNFAVSQTHTVTYYLKDNKTVSTLETKNESGTYPWLITDGYFEDAKVYLDVTDGSKKVTIGSFEGASVSFYESKNLFNLQPNTTIPASNWYFTNSAPGDFVGFTFTTYPISQTYKNVTFDLNADSTNQRAFTFAEGVTVTNPAGNGKVVYTVVTASGTEDREIVITKGVNLVGNTSGEFILADGEYIKDVHLEFDEIVANQALISGQTMGVYLRTNEPLGTKAKDGKEVKPAEQYSMEVVFKADNYKSSTAISKPDLSETPGSLGLAHATINPITALFGTYTIDPDPENYRINYTSTPKAVGDEIDASRNIYQGQEVTFDHQPTMAWEFYAGLMPSSVHLDNPKVYYVVDSAFSYVPGSLTFKDPSGAVKTPEVKFYANALTISGKKYGIIEASFYNSGDAKTSYTFDMGSAEKINKAIGDVTFKLKASQVVTGLNFGSIYASWVDFGNNIATDPVNYMYSHEVSKYQLPPNAINTITTAGADREFLPLGTGGNFNIKKNSKLGILNEAATPSARGLEVSGSDVTKFSHELVVTPAGIDSYNFVMYVPLVKKGESYTYTRSGTTITLPKADYSFDLRGPVTVNSIANGSTITQPANVKITYGGNKSAGIIPTQDGLTGDFSLEAGYENYNVANAKEYTMVKVVIPVIKQDTDYLSLSVPMDYSGSKTTLGKEVDKINVMASYGKLPGTYNHEVLNGSDLTYNVTDYKISGYMWQDTNNNQRLDANTVDPRWKNENVTATRTIDSVNYDYSAKTNADGYYEITVPGGGNYDVKFPDKLTGFTYPNAWDFVTPNASGVSDALSSKALRDPIDYGIAKVVIADTNVNSVNAGYYRGLPDNALIEDIVLWVGESGYPVLNNPNNLPITIIPETLSDGGKQIASVGSTGLIVGINVGVVHKTYTYPDGLGGVVTKTFKITVLNKYLVTYDVQPDASGDKHGTLTKATGSPDGLQETIKDSVNGNKVNYVPTPKGEIGATASDPNWVFDGWYYDDDVNTATPMVVFDPDTVEIHRNTDVYATFTPDENKDGIGDKYQVQFIFMSNDANGNASNLPQEEWVTRYKNPNLTGSALTDLSNLSETEPVSPTKVPTPSTVTGYHFTQWIDDETPTRSYPAASAASLIKNTKYAAIDGNVVFEAFFILNDYRVDYITDGHGSLEPHTNDAVPLLEEQVTHGNKVAEIPTPMNEIGATETDSDWVFDGWYWDHDLDAGTAMIAFDPNTQIVRDSTVVATFTEDKNKDGVGDKYQIIFRYVLNPHGEFSEGEASYEEYVTRTPATSTTGTASPVNVPTPKGIDGYIFTNWELIDEPTRSIGSVYADNSEVKNYVTQNDSTFLAVFHRAPTMIDDEDVELEQQDINVVNDADVYHVEATTTGAIKRQVDVNGKLLKDEELISHINKSYYTFKGNGIENDNLANATILDIVDKNAEPSRARAKNLIEGIDERVAGLYDITIELVNENGDITIATIEYELTPLPITPKPSKPAPGVKSPDTGDTTDIFQFASVLLIAFAVIIRSRKNREEDEEII